MNLNQLPDFYENSLVAILHSLGAAYFALKDKDDLVTTAGKMAEARNLTYSTLGLAVLPPGEDATDISKESLRLEVVSVFHSVDGALQELWTIRSADNDSFAAECAWVEKRGVRHLQFVKSRLDTLLSTQLLGRYRPIPSVSVAN